MVLASELRAGMVVCIEGQPHKVIEVESKAGAAKMGGVVKAKLINVRSGRMWEPHLGTTKGFLQPGMELPVEFFEGEAISVVFPEVAEARVAQTAAPSHSQRDSAWKEAILENGLAIRVPLFIAPGETVRVDVRTGRYVERGRVQHKRSA